jgi:hypothetical protein
VGGGGGVGEGEEWERGRGGEGEEGEDMVFSFPQNAVVVLGKHSNFAVNFRFSI